MAQYKWVLKISSFYLAFRAVHAMITNTMAPKSINYLSSPSSVVLFVFLALFTCLPPAVAQGTLRIVDCQGKTRAVKQTSVESTDVQVKLNSTEIQNASLTNRKGDVIQGSVSDGIATFAAVPTDIWVLSTNTPGGFFSEITFNSTPAGFWVDAGNIALVTAGIVGAVLIGGAFDGDSSGDNGDASSGGGGCSTCNPDQGAPSIGPFSSIRR